jgi:hypothetical protein
MARGPRSGAEVFAPCVDTGSERPAFWRVTEGERHEPDRRSGTQQVQGVHRQAGSRWDGGDAGRRGRAAEVEAWVKSAKVAPKSIGVEYIESRDALLLSVGYRDDEDAYPVQLSSIRIGKIESTDAAGLAKIESAMAAASAKLSNVICHELYVTKASDPLMVVISHQAG